MVEILLNKKWYNVPTKWNELTAKQLVKIIAVFEAPGEVDEARMKLLKILSGISVWRWVMTDVEELNEYLYLTDFLLQANSLTENVRPKYKGFAGPSSDFENLLMCEFAYTEPLFFKWVEESSIDALNQLVAILYRKKKKGYDEGLNKDGDVRIAFNEYECKYFSNKKISKWPIDVKKAVAFWYDGCRRKLIEDFPEVFGGSGESAKYGLLETIMDVAKEGVHGNFKDVEKLPVRMVMVSIDKAIREAEKIKQAHG